MLALLLLVACPTPKEDDTATSCPEMTCADAVTFVLHDPLGELWLGAFEGAAMFSDASTISFTCPDGTGEGYICGDSSVTVYTSEATFNVTFTAGDTYASGAVSPEYEPEMPGGEACGVYCEQATMDVQLEVEDGC